MAGRASASNLSRMRQNGGPAIVKNVRFAVDRSSDVTGETNEDDEPTTPHLHVKTPSDRRHVRRPATDWTLPDAASPEQREQVERLRARVQFFFMCPVSKWRTRRQMPFKLVLQLLKVILVTAQLCVFASRRFSFVGYMSDTQVVLEHVLLPMWDPVREINAYPPSTGPLAVYTRRRLYSTLDHVVNNYYNIERQVLADISYPNNSGALARLCIDSFSNNIASDAFNSHVVQDGVHQDELTQRPLLTTCVDLKPTSLEIHARNFSTRSFLHRRRIELPFVDVTALRLSLALRGVQRKMLSRLDVPQCYRLNATIQLLNTQQDGQFRVHLRVVPQGVLCASASEGIHEGSESLNSRPAGHKISAPTDTLVVQVLLTLLNVVVMLVCAASLAMCVRSIVRALRLRALAERTLFTHFDYQLSTSERLRFCQLWYVCIVVNDGLIILASAAKIRLDNLAADEVFGSYVWNLCSVALGVGTLLVWLGVLRYLSFFHEYNVLILTVKGSVPAVLRFSVCALIVYSGFALCGWMVLSPYHMKFRSFSETSEALFSLMNGDDMFATFAEVSRHSPLVYWFSKVYIYLFVSSFIYLVLSLMISIIMDTFDTIKLYYKHGFPRSPLDDFCMTQFVERDDQSEEDSSEDPPSPSAGFGWLRCCCCPASPPPAEPRTRHNRSAHPTDTTPILDEPVAI